MYIELSEASEFKGLSGSNIKTEKHCVVRKWPQIWNADFSHCSLPPTGEKTKYREQKN